MNLITVLIALGVEARFGNFDRYRSLVWFERYGNWLEARLGTGAYWNGVTGLLVTLSIPLLLLGLIIYLAAKVHFVLGFVLSFLVLVYSFGPPLNSLINRYMAALAADEVDTCKEVLEQILPGAASAADNERVISSIMFKAHEYLFAVIFWFFVLGPVGALLYCLVVSLSDRYEKIHGGYADAVKDLHNILMWPSARLLALGFALGGSLVGSLESWRTVSGNTLETSSDVITASAFGALHYSSEDEQEPGAGNEVFIGRLKETLALINRTLIVWLIVLGLMTIAGWIS